jgi:hypothetical protein
MESTNGCRLVKPKGRLESRELQKDSAGARSFPAFELVTGPVLDTAAAAHYLNRRPQTLRGLACYENGPIRPTRINGRLAWSVQVLRGLLGGAV